MQFVDLPLPSRSLAFSSRPFALPAAFFFTVIMLAGLAIGLGWWQGPGLWRDVQISQNPITLYDADVLDGECNTRRGLTDCAAHLLYDYKGKSYDTYVQLAFLDFSSDDYSVDVVISADKPELATVSLGLEMLWNRLAVFAVFIVLFGGGALATIWSAIQAGRANRSAGQSGRLDVVPVHVAGLDERRGVRHASYTRVKDGKRKGGVIRTRFAAGEGPLMAVGDNGVVYGVGVQSEHLSWPVLLDSGLRRLDLSDAERQRALDAFDAQQSERGGAPQAISQKPKVSPAKAALRGLMAAGLVLVMLVAGIFGYWVYYATSAGDAFDAVGIEINNLMPEPLNSWACSQLYERFGDERAPFGCTADDHTSWKVARSTKTK